MMAHGNRPPPSSGLGAGAKCPFRAALQAQSLQTSASTESTTAGIVANKATVKEEEVEEKTEEGKTACKCAADGLQPRGEPSVNGRSGCSGACSATSVVQVTTATREELQWCIV